MKQVEATVNLFFIGGSPQEDDCRPREARRDDRQSLLLSGSFEARDDRQSLLRWKFQSKGGTVILFFFVGTRAATGNGSVGNV